MQYRTHAVNHAASVNGGAFCVVDKNQCPPSTLGDIVLRFAGALQHGAGRKVQRGVAAEMQRAHPVQTRRECDHAAAVRGCPVECCLHRFRVFGGVGAGRDFGHRPAAVFRRGFGRLREQEQVGQPLHAKDACTGVLQMEAHTPFFLRQLPGIALGVQAGSLCGAARNGNQHVRGRRQWKPRIVRRMEAGPLFHRDRLTIDSHRERRFFPLRFRTG